MNAGRNQRSAKARFWDVKVKFWWKVQGDSQGRVVSGFVAEATLKLRYTPVGEADFWNRAAMPSLESEAEELKSSC